MTRKVRIIQICFFCLVLMGVYFSVKKITSHMSQQVGNSIPRIAVILPDNKTLSSMADYRLGIEQAALDYNCDVIYVTLKQSIPELVELIEKNNIDVVFSNIPGKTTNEIWQSLATDIKKVVPDKTFVHNNVSKMANHLLEHLGSQKKYVMPAKTPTLEEELLYQELMKKSKMTVLLSTEDIYALKDDSNLIVINPDDLLEVSETIEASQKFNLAGIGGDNQLAYFTQEGVIETLVVKDGYSEGYQSIQQAYALVEKDEFMLRPIQIEGVTKENIYQEKVQRLLFFD